MDIVTGTVPLRQQTLAKNHKSQAHLMQTVRTADYPCLCHLSECQKKIDRFIKPSPRIMHIMALENTR